MSDRPTGARISVLATWQEAVVFTARRAPLWLGLALAPVYALTIVNLYVVEPLSRLTLGLTTLAGLQLHRVEFIIQAGLTVVIVVYGVLAFPTLWHEICLAEPHDRLWPLLARWRRQRWHAIGIHTIVMLMASVGGLILTIVLFSAATLAGMLVSALPPLVMLAIGSPGLAVVVFQAACVLLIYCRYALAVPNIASGGRGGLGDAVRRVRGNYWRLFVAGAAPLAAMVVLLIASTGNIATDAIRESAGSYADAVANLLRQFVLFAGITAHVSIVAFFYRRLRDHVPIEVFD